MGTVLAASLAALVVPGCGEVTESAAATDPCADDAGADCAAREAATPSVRARQHRPKAKRAADGMTGPGRNGAAGDSGGAPPAAVVADACTVCAAAEVCCKAEGFNNCGYATACKAATAAAQNEFYLVLCRAVLSASADGAKPPPDACRP